MTIASGNVLRVSGVQRSAPGTASARACVARVQLASDWEPGREQPRRWSFLGPRPLWAFPGGLELGAMAQLGAAFVALLQRYAQQRELPLDVIVQHTTQVERRSLRFSVDDEQSFAALAAVARSSLVSAAESAAEGSNVALTFAPSTPHSAARWEPIAFFEQHDLHFVIVHEHAQLALWVRFDAARFRTSTIERMLESLSLLGSAALAEPETALHALPILSRAAVSTLEQACDGRRGEAHDELVHELFARLARERPDALAARQGERAMSYRELDERTARLAHYLLAVGVQGEVVVGVCLPPSLELLVAILAIFKAGGAYLPLDPRQPRALVASIVEEARPALVLTESTRRSLLPAGYPQFCFDRDWDVVQHMPVSKVTANIELDQTSCVFYTAGTTGRPKGVVSTHRNIAHFLGVARRRYGFSGEDTFCSLAPPARAISLFELLLPLTCGASVRLLAREVVLDPARLSVALEQVTVVHAEPRLFARLFRHLRERGGRAFPSLRHASCGGAFVPSQLLDEMKRTFPDAALFVVYGCAEVSSMGCTHAVSRAARSTRAYAGKPFPDTVLRLLDRYGHLVPFGVVGEICFAGKGVARRYLGRPRLTSERFVCIDGQRFYRTGDLGRLSAEGQLEVVGLVREG